PIELEGPRTIRGKNFYVKHSRLDRVEIRDGMRVVHPLSAARAVPRGTERALERFYSGPAGKRRFLRDIARSRRISARLRSLLQRISIGADTWGERILGRQLRACGLTVEHNVRMLGYRFDLVLGKYGIVVEIDGWEYHKSLDSFICDRWKTSNASASGFVVLRFTADCVQTYLDKVVDKILQAVAWVKNGRPRAGLLNNNPLPAHLWHQYVI
ncbi:MAG: DUF559 domain-containing protein, partial [Corynebacterium sp.]|nr:DUF559 domain-containing protein [Corynebacterium sp.]